MCEVREEEPLLGSGHMYARGSCSRVRIRLPRATRAAELGETRECPESCPCPQHGRLAA